MHQLTKSMNKEDMNGNDLQTIITHGLNQIKEKMGPNFDIRKVNLAEMQRITGVSRAKLRRLKKNNFVVSPHGRTGQKADKTVLTGFTETIDNLLRQNVTNAQVIYDRLKEKSYTGGITQIRVYIEAHRNLIPPKRQLVSPQGNRGRRYSTPAGESYQMDWGFIDVDTNADDTYRLACFVMVCHHCGMCYIEFFTNARQENLFIGMLHAFQMMGIPRYVLTDNMKSVVIRRASDGSPIWQKDYERFMNTVGFETKLCKPRHPFTKGASERLVRFVKENFLPGRIFTELPDLNYQADHWCLEQNNRYHQSHDCVPFQMHGKECSQKTTRLELTDEIRLYLAPERTISFDGFVAYEGRRFGVPYGYEQKTCRVMRDGYTLYIYDQKMQYELTHHNVTWSRKDSFCADQYPKPEPEEEPTAPVKAGIHQKESTDHDPWFDQFNLEEGKWHE